MELTNNETKTFWAITSYFNPAGYKNKLENYRKFREASKKQGLNLLVVELAFNNDPFELAKEDADILIQVRSNSIMWQKERLLNIGLDHLPKDCDKVAWIDADVIFKNDNWIQDASQLLEKHPVIQLFSFFVRLKGDNNLDNVSEYGFGLYDGEISFGMVNNFLQLGDFTFNSKDYIFRGRPGLGWAARRSFIEKVKFFDSSIMGSNDIVFVDAMYGTKFYSRTNKYPEAMLRDYDDWVKEVSLELDGSVSCIDNIALHLWHGDIKDRGYGKREGIFLRHNFDPKKDITINKDGCFEWASDKPDLHKEVRDYFYQRKEDGENVLARLQPTKTFWAITSYFNPAGYKNKLENYRKFREASKKQGLNLLVVELAFNNDPFELAKEDADILIQVRSNSIMWQKERLLNIGLDHLPKDCDKVAWIDADVIFKNDNWIQDASQLLEKHPVIQLFSFFVNLPKNIDVCKFDGLRYGLQCGELSCSFVRNVLDVGNEAASPGVSRPGIAWAAKVSFLKKHYFFEKAILGGSDEVMANVFCKRDFVSMHNFFPKKLSDTYNDWAQKVSLELSGSPSCIDNIALHLWHGEFSNRRYSLRQSILTRHDFDPEKDITINKDGCFEWATDKPELHKEVRDYFYQRKEDKQ